ncbi:MAG: PHP domain-containing protein [Candidatus Aminicenantes bacterium]|nr:PHP domain-containing protein [Candidatus Aminicenantes bacterium]
MDTKTDLHLHTLVSDGTCTPLEMLEAARQSGLETISFTDHDAIGAYRHWGDLFAAAEAAGLALVSGVELDVEYRGEEIHLLGYGFALEDEALNRRLRLVQGLRRRKVLRQLEDINRFFGRKVVERRKVLLPHRDSLMKPHLVHAMLNQGLFPEYRAAAQWLSANAQVPIHVPKLTIVDAINMIVHAGGEAVLAHPGYIACETEISLDAMLEELVPLGLGGVEVDYPYLGTAEAFADAASEKAMIDRLRGLAQRFKLKATRGSDAHDAEALKKFAERV